jgi:hypothetical protein
MGDSVDSVWASMRAFSSSARWLSLPSLPLRAAAATAMRSATRAASSSRLSFEGLPLRGGVLAHAREESLEGRRELLRLEVSKRLVEDLVPGVISGVSRHEDGRARVKLPVVGVMEEAEFLGHDDEALLRELA